MNATIIRGTLAALCMSAVPTMYAAEAETPIIEFHTNIYETYGSTNSFHIVLGAKEDIYLDIDCGFGTFEAEVGPAIYDQDSQSISATSISCTVSASGIVRIYGDASKIDYFDCEGCYIDRISFPDLTELQILDMSHNELKALDLSHMTKLESIVLTDNPFDESPLVIGANKPALTILEMSIVGHLDQSFNLSDYPSMASFEAYHCDELYTLDPTGCPELLRLSADVTPLQSLDVSKNTKLLILNVSDTYITSIDVSKNPYLTEFYCGHAGSFAPQYKIDQLDVTHNTMLQRFYCQHNALTSLDISKNTSLVSFSCQGNNLPGIDFTNNPSLNNVDVSDNRMDFNTIPLPRANMTEYNYAQQPLEVARCYAEGDVIDLTARVIREGSTTDAVVYAVKEESGTVELLSDDYYKWDNGRITLLKECSDSLYAAFANDLFPEAILTTARFMVKTADAFGKPSKAVSFRVSASSSSFSFGVGVDGATAENPKTFMVDFGDGNLKEFTATTTVIPAQSNVSGTRAGASGIVVYIPEGSTITALSIEDVRLLSTDLTKAPTLRQLRLSNCQLSTIDLTWNRCLTSLDLSSNNFKSIDLSGVNGNYGKNVLSNINLSNNSISQLTLNDGATIEHLDLSNNSLESIPLERNSNLRYLNVSWNYLSEIDLTDCEALDTLDISNNMFTAFEVPATSPVTHLNLAGNMLYFPALPAADKFTQYTYAPQQPVLLPAKAPVVDLSAMMLGTGSDATVFTWYHTNGTPATSDEVTANGAVFTFSGADAGSLYCAMTNPAFPDFNGDNAYLTSTVEAADMPTEVFLEFTTTESAQASISLTGVANNTTVYIDWNGNGNLVQYILKTTYTEFPVTTHAGAKVKAYAYDTDNGVTMCSISGVKMADIDASRLKQTNAFFLYGAGLEDGTITLPANPELSELTISGCNITGIDLSAYKNLRTLALNDNKIESIDISAFKTLEAFHASGNGMKNITFGNPALWELNLSDNQFESIDLAGVPAVSQLWLTGNNLSAIDVDGLTDLRVLAISNNKFTFTTLPEVKSTYYLYDYGKQASIEITVDAVNKVDLSSQAVAAGQNTTYTWYIDSPYYDEEDNLVGENLIEGDEYTIDNGVTTFLADFHNIMCVMQNPAFPSLVLYTNFIDVTGVSGIDGITADTDTFRVRAQGGTVFVETDDENAPVAIYTISGACIGSNHGTCSFSSIASGVYVVTVANRAVKVAVK